MEYSSLLQEAASYQKKLTDYRHYLHAHAEVDFDLSQTVAYVKEQLTQMGYDPVPLRRIRPHGYSRRQKTW